MDKWDLQYFCGVIAGLSGIPVRIYRGDRQVFFSSVVSLPKDPMAIYQKDIWAISDQIGRASCRERV